MKDSFMTYGFNTFSGSASNPHRIARSGAGASILRSRGGEMLGEEAMAAAAPSIFAMEKHESRTDKYTYIPTIEVLRGLIKEGFRPVEVRQGGSRVEGKREFTKHMIRMRHAGTSMDKLMRVGDSVRELVLVNSHDGTSSYQLMDGLFRLVCTNGLITCEAGEIQRVAHKGDVIGEVIEGAYHVIQNGANVADKVESMRGLVLNAGEANAFASAALSLRYNAKDAETGEAKAAPIEPSQVLRPRRAEDADNNLWNVFNRTQEHLMTGGQGYVHRAANGRRSRRETRPVNSIDGNVSINRALWVLAQEMGKLKAA